MKVAVLAWLSRIVVIKVRNKAHASIDSSKSKQVAIKLDKTKPTIEMYWY